MIETPEEILYHHADTEAVDSFIAYRKKHKRAALTDRGALMIAKSLVEINRAGGDATEALDLAQEHGWQTIKPEWYWKAKNGNGNRNTRTSNADASDREIAFASRAIRTPSIDCI